jgi:hypothetical protein
MGRSRRASPILTACGADPEPDRYRTRRQLPEQRGPPVWRSEMSPTEAISASVGVIRKNFCVLIGKNMSLFWEVVVLTPFEAFTGFLGPEICLFRPFQLRKRKCHRFQYVTRGKPGTDGVPWPYNELLGFYVGEMSVSVPGCRCPGYPGWCRVRWFAYRGPAMVKNVWLQFLSG